MPDEWRMSTLGHPTIPEMILKLIRHTGDELIATATLLRVTAFFFEKAAA